MNQTMRGMIIVLIMSAILIGAALTRGITYAFTHALGLPDRDTPHHVVAR